MTLEMKDVLYLIMSVLAFGGIWFRIGGRITKMEETVKNIKGVMFRKDGTLGVTTPEQCAEKREIIQKAQDKADIAYARIESELRELSNNVLIIITHLNIDVDEVKKRGIKRG